MITDLPEDKISMIFGDNYDTIMLVSLLKHQLQLAIDHLVHFVSYNDYPYMP